MNWIILNMMRQWKQNSKSDISRAGAHLLRSLMVLHHCRFWVSCLHFYPLRKHLLFLVLQSKYFCIITVKILYVLRQSEDAGFKQRRSSSHQPCLSFCNSLHSLWPDTATNLLGQDICDCRDAEYEWEVFSFLRHNMNLFCFSVNQPSDPMGSQGVEYGVSYFRQ